MLFRSYAIINRRLLRRTREANAPFRAAGYGTSDLFREGRATELTIDTVDGQWRRGMVQAGQEYHRALTYGYASEDQEAREGTLTPLFEKIVSHVPAPAADVDGPFKFLVTLLDRDNFLGRILTGKVQSGTIKVNSPIHALDNDGKIIETGRASKLMAFRGLDRVPVEEARAGDIISIAGLTEATVSNTICDPSVTEPLHAQPIDPPTLSMRFAVNDSPMAGREGDRKSVV